MNAEVRDQVAKMAELSLREVLDVATLLLKMDVDYGQNIESMSYQHANGFAKIVLFDWPMSNIELRAHIWGEGRGTASNIHDHTRPFVSQVYAGKILVETFKYGTGTRHYRYICSSEPDGRHSLTMRGSEDLAISSAVEVSSGNGHSSSVETLHRVTPASAGPIITLFLQGKKSRTVTNVFSKRNIAFERPVVRLDADEIRTKLLAAREIS